MAHVAVAPTFVGREAELAAFAAATLRARSGTASVLLVSGEAGIGKSTFVREAARRVEAPLYLARCGPHGGDVTPLAPLADLLRQVRRAHVDVGSEVVDPLLRWLSPTSAARSAIGPGDLFEPVLDLVGALGDQGAVVAFEDLHWADTATWDLLDFLARNLSDEGAVLVGTYRSDEIRRDPAQRRRIAELVRLDAVEAVALVGWAPTEVAARVDAMIGRAAPPDLVAEILDRGQGNPFFTEQLVAAHVAGEQLPALLSELLEAELAAVDDAARQVLGVIATIGRDTTHELLAKVADVAEGALEAALQSAIDARLVVVDDGSDRYRFRHALIGEVAYRRLLPSQRARLHARVAAALRDQPATALARADRAGELAFHLDRAGDEEGAFAASLAAADAAGALAPGAAFTHLQRALQLWPAGVDHQERVRRMWEVSEFASGVVGNDAGAELAREAFAAGDPPRGRAWGHERLARYLAASGQLIESRKEYDLAESALTGPADPGAPGVFSGLAQAEVMACHFDEAEAWCRRLFEIVGDPDVDALAWTVTSRVAGLVAATRGDVLPGVELCRRAAASAPGSQARGIAVMYLCVALLELGENQEVVDLAGDAVADAQRSGIDPSFGAYTGALGAEALTRLGRWAEADAVLARHLGAAALPAGALRAACAGAVLAARRGDRPQAARLLERARSQSTDDWHQALLHLRVAEVELACGDWAAAKAAADTGLTATPKGAPMWEAPFLHVFVDASVELCLDVRAAGGADEREEAARALEQRVDQVDGPVGDSPAVVAHLAHARASLTRLRAPDADAWGSASTAWAALGDRWWWAVARGLEGEAAAMSGAAARAADALRDAHDAAVSMGAAALRDQIEAIARRSRLSLDAPSPLTLGTTTVEQLGLTPREAEVLELVSAGLTNRQIGERLFVSEKTASVHVSNILRKMGATSRVDAAAMAQRLRGV